MCLRVLEKCIHFTTDCILSLLIEFELTHIDEFVDELLRQDRVCDVILPRIQVRERERESLKISEYDYIQECFLFSLHLHVSASMYVSKFVYMYRRKQHLVFDGRFLQC